MGKKLYTIEQASKILDAYIDDSAKRLRKRLKSAWVKSQSFKVGSRAIRYESLLHR